ncbi:ZIP zinc transporter [Methylophilales bacterium MBRSG12]|uniref:ZIP zinc transporter n=1 Tax=Methylophilales bacterium MBRS-H7 TaxID=1623450 RepID=A0A0H4IZD8_9PROT|nr:ZIP zinc transporter [Methylophilales bacterium MBRSF5]AKO66331.1 ZIP zinc transporter [Methylophilales bacterium MBRS-H7]AKO67647.1 ZIP zinc transporter [Methylophilales bacterium MBRSG12]
MNLLVIIAVCFFGSLLSLTLAYLFSKLKMVNYADYFVSFAVGTLLGAAFLEIIPHAYELSRDLHQISLIVLIGILVFFILEKLLVWRHCHGSHCENHSPVVNHDVKKGSILIIGDCFHNFIDGILISSAFIVDINLGLITALAIIVHEIPQEISNFSILINSGYSLSRTLVMNIVTGCAMILGAILAYFVLNDLEFLIPMILAFAASSMIYVAISDLIPSLHQKVEIKQTLQQTFSIFLGVLIIYFLHSLIH